MFCSGFHEVPVRKSTSPISRMAGTPLANRNMHMSATAMIDTSAESVNRTCIKPSLNFFIKPPFGGYSYPPNIPLFLYSSSALQVVSSPM